MGFWDYTRAILAIVVVIFAAYYVTRKFGQMGGGTPMRRAPIKIVGTTPLGRDRSLVLVTVGSKTYLLGVTAQHIERIDEYPAEELPIEPVPETPTSGFQAELLTRLQEWRKNGKS